MFTMEIIPKGQRMDYLCKFILMGSITMDFLKKICITARASIFGINHNIFLVILIQGIKFGVGWRERSDIKAVLKEISAMAKERAGILLEKFILATGKMVNEMDRALSYSLQGQSFQDIG